ncbi:MAG TPA: hypothetical protein VGO56_16590 [Pyrinomonadaceae bacterium]|jgi:hypothetical protein|nr:hypothetical protein [Pyrinomonadaceae bacterium]
MKASLIISILLLSLSAGPRIEKARAVNAWLNAPAVSTAWPEDALVNVYFVRDMFSAGERQTLQEAMENWTKRSGARDVGISFVFAGETGGLIDCERCLTIARQGFSANAERVALKVLRQDESGRLLSAWIAMEHVAATPATLKNQLLQALERGLGVSDSRISKNAR